MLERGLNPVDHGQKVHRKRDGICFHAPKLCLVISSHNRQDSWCCSVRTLSCIMIIQIIQHKDICIKPNITQYIYRIIIHFMLNAKYQQDKHNLPLSCFICLRVCAPNMFCVCASEIPVLLCNTFYTKTQDSD